MDITELINTLKEIEIKHRIIIPLKIHGCNHLLMIFKITKNGNIIYRIDMDMKKMFEVKYENLDSYLYFFSEIDENNQINTKTI